MLTADLVRACRSQRLGLPALWLSALVLSAGAAGCEDDSLGMAGVDSGVMECPGGGTRPIGRCATDDDCCDRESCNASIGVCFSIDECDNARPCENPEQVCVDRDDDGDNECVYERCDDDDPNACIGQITCPPDRIVACIAGGCQCGEPCQGGCGPGQGCCVPTDLCQPLPEMCLGLTCPRGQFVSVTSTGAWSTGDCRVVGETCECERLPPLPEGDIGLHSAITHDGRTPVVSAYNLDYGDLMFGVVQRDGTFSWEFVDGVPTSTEAITGDIDGPRGGNSLVGEDVGLYTDLEVDSMGRPHIAYQDRDRGALKYAIGATGGWRVHTIEGDGPGDTGLYASLALNAGDHARVAFLSAREPIPGTTNGRRSVLRLAFTATVTPSGPSSWETRDLQTVDLSSRPCADRCHPGEVCRASDEVCVEPDRAPTTCGSTCTSDQRCVQGRCTAIEPLPAFQDLPLARGLWPSLRVLPDGGILIAFYDRLQGALKLARIAGPDLRNGTLELVEVDGFGVNGSTDDAGLFPSLFVTPAGEIHLTYMNQTRQSLVYRNLAPDLTTLVVETVEAGLGASGGPDGALIGADSSVVVDRLGLVRVAYQDASTGDLRYARREAGAWTSFTLAGNEATYRGSFGFYADQTLDRNREAPVVSSYRYFLSAELGPKNGLETFSPP